jgi:hypothetical protein
VARAVFKTVEALARGLVGSIPTRSRHVPKNVAVTARLVISLWAMTLTAHYALSARSLGGNTAGRLPTRIGDTDAHPPRATARLQSRLACWAGRDARLIRTTIRDG